MNKLISSSKLSFLTVTHFMHDRYSRFDASNSPRPHFCMARLAKGRAVFCDTKTKNRTELSEGDIILVVQGECYVSEWFGESEIEYTSVHFSFEHSGVFPKEGKYFIQKISGADLPVDMRELYDEALRAYELGESFKTLECFYKILGAVEPLLKSIPQKATDQRIADAIEYIEQNYRSAIKIDDLAAHVSMSVPRFFPKFKEQTGITPIEYINRYRVNRAILLLISDDDLSIESIAEMAGFESSAYFRRTFKKITGLSPRAYRSSAVEI